MKEDYFLYISEHRTKARTHNKKYMSIAVSVVCEQRFSASAFVLRGWTEARKSATAYISARCGQLRKTILS